MSPFDVPPDEMGKDLHITDEELEALLDGRPSEASGDLARFVDDLRATFPADAPATEAHLAAMIEATQLFADNGDPVVRPVSNADAPPAEVSRLPKRREYHMKERTWRTLVLRVAAPIVALFTVLGIMGSAGALPRGLQRLTSHAAGLVGFELPSGEDTEGDSGDLGENVDDQGDDTKDGSAAVEDDQGDDSQGDSVATTEDDQGDNSQGDSTDTTTEGDQGENDDSQGDSTSVDTSNQDDQGDSTSSDQGNQDDQGDNSQDEGSGGSTQDDQGDSSGDSSKTSGSGDNNQN
jgi:hypothetical protein